MAITSINLGKIKFNWRGPWLQTTSYVKDDVVQKLTILQHLTIINTLIIP